MLFSPLEQFQVNPIFDLNSCFVQYFSSIPVVLDVTLTPFGIFVLYILFIMFLQLFFYFSYAYFIPSRAQFIFEQVYMFVFGIVYKTSSKHKTNLFPFLTETLLVITLCNFLGLVPYTQTLTSTLIIPVFWSFAFNFSFFLWGCYLHGVYFLRNFSPRGVPLLLVPLMIVIEVMSYLIRPFSLALRLFANMMAGHALLHILASFVVLPLVFLALGLLLAPFPFFLVLFIYLLEVGIALLQAYVFVTLLAIYYNEAVSLH